VRQKHSHGELIAFRERELDSVAFKVEKDRNMTAHEASKWILERTPGKFSGEFF
jgi:hypothetical protein